jgi:hypothetical protein
MTIPERIKITATLIGREVESSSADSTVLDPNTRLSLIENFKCPRPFKKESCFFLAKISLGALYLLAGICPKFFFVLYFPTKLYSKSR